MHDILIINIHFFIDCLHEGDIVKKAERIILDNASNNDAAFKKLQTKLEGSH